MWHGEGVIRDCEALKKNHVENQHRTAGNDLFQLKNANLPLAAEETSTDLIFSRLALLAFVLARRLECQSVALHSVICRREPEKQS